MWPQRGNEGVGAIRLATSLDVLVEDIVAHHRRHKIGHPKQPSNAELNRRQRLLSQALSAIPDDPGDEDWTVAVLSEANRQPGQRDLHDRLSDAFLAWAWNGAFRDWYSAVRALARAVRGLEASGLIERHTTRKLGERPRRTWALSELGRDILAALAMDLTVPQHGPRRQG